MMGRREVGLWYDEIEDFLLYVDFVGAYGCVHESSVNADERSLRFFDSHLTCTVWVYTFVVEYFPAIEQIESLYQLCHLRVVDHRDIEQSVVGHGAGCEPISLCIAYAYCHHLSVDDISIDE